MSIIELQSVFKSYHGQAVLEDVSLKVQPGERLVILGPSGCGKTTVLRLIAGFIPPDSGKIAIGGTLVAADGKIFQEPEYRNLGMVFQDLALWPHLTVKGNLEFGLKAKAVQAREREQRIGEILKLLQMEKYLHAKPSELSGGEQQRIAMARALVLHPNVMLMDEPLSSVDLELNYQLRKEIIRLQELIGFALLYVTHNREEAFDVATRIVLMSHCAIEYIGSVEDMRKRFSLVGK